MLPSRKKKRARIGTCTRRQFQTSGFRRNVTFENVEELEHGGMFGVTSDNGNFQGALGIFLANVIDVLSRRVTRVLLRALAFTATKKNNNRRELQL